MTIQDAKSRLVSWCNSQVGYHEGTDNFNKYAEKLDKIDGLTWGPKQNQPWCGEFVLAGYVDCFGVDLALRLLCSPKPTSIPLCSAGAGYFKQAGQWFVSPQVGDVVFFVVNGAINHTGVVTSVGMGAITTVEGNSGDMVARNSHPLNSPRLAGFGRPRWELVEQINSAQDDSDQIPADPQPEPDPAPVMFSLTLPQLQEGDVSQTVKAAQAMLISEGFRCGPWANDGEFGPGTKNAVQRFQRSRGLTQDGIIGPETFRALLGVMA